MTTAPAPAPAGRRSSPTFAIYRLMLTQQLTRARVFMLVGAGLIGILVAFALRNSQQTRPDQVGALLVAFFGLEIFVPVTALLLASATLGDANDDGTLVYLWLRPVARWKMVAAAGLVSFAVTWPITVPTLVVAAALTGAGRDLTVATLIAATLMVFAYTGVFMALGVRVKRPLVWGLLYIFIWEGFVARAGPTAARLAVRAYGSSILNRFTDTEVVLGEIDLSLAIVVPVLVGIAGFAYAVFRLRRQDVA